tara:strand:+ start:578 stop:724 length:147 start_codon:yes stop_codon:yes gene_type:complete
MILSYTQTIQPLFEDAKVPYFVSTPTLIEIYEAHLAFSLLQIWQNIYS